MGGANVGSLYAIPDRIIPERGQVSENSAKPSAWLFAGTSKQFWHVLHDCEAWSNLANNSGELGP
jgi:hypothetical protein